MTVKNILRSKKRTGVVSVSPSTSVSRATMLLAEHGIGTVVVSEGGETPDGILSERDIVRALAREGAACLKRPVEDLMTQRVQTCNCDDPAVTVMERMTSGRFRHMPVMDGGRMVALISLGDVVKMRLGEVRAERDALEDMVMGR